MNTDPIIEKHRLYMIRQADEKLERKNIKIETAKLYKPIYQANYSKTHKEQISEYNREYRLKKKIEANLIFID